MSIVATAISRRVTVAMATLAVALFGSLSLERLGLNLLPELAYPTLTVRTDFEGAAPAEVEEQITRRLEERVGVINGLRRMHSISAAERSDLVLEFAWGTDMNGAAVEVREKLDLAQLPLDVERPSILRLNPNLDPIVRAAIVLRRPSGEDAAALQELRRFAEDVVKKRLDPVLGVAAVLVSGGYEDEISVHVDQDRLAQLGLSVQALGQRLQAANINLSGGRLTDRGQEYLVRTLNEFGSVADIGETIVYQEAGRVLRLKEVAEVREGHKERDSVMRVQGLEAIEIAMYKEGDANTVTVAAAISERLDAIARDLPEAYELVVIHNQADFITAAIDEVRSAAVVGAFFAVLVLYLFLRDARSTLIVTATIPASVLGTFVLMDAFDITLNIMSLGGIALAVGMLMDNAIVVLENIARYRESDARLSLPAAAGRGASEVAGAVLASTLTTIAVFLPLAFVEGVAGQLFRDQALTVTFALVASLLLAFTLIPMLAAIGAGTANERSSSAAPAVQASTAPGPLGWQRLATAPLRGAIRATVLLLERLGAGLALALRPIHWGFDAAYARAYRGYVALLNAALRFRAATLLAAAASLAGSAALLPALPVELIPPLSQGEFRADLELAPGTRLEATDQVLAEAQARLLDYPVVERTYSVAGTGGKLDATATRGGEQVGELNVVLMEGIAPADENLVMALARDALAAVPGVQFKVDKPQPFTFATPLEVEVSGNHLPSIERVAAELAAAMAASPAFSDVESTIRPGYPELQIVFDQERTAAAGLLVPEVAARVVRKIRGDVPTKFTWRDKRVDIRVRLAETARNSKADVENLLVDAGGRQVRLASLATVQLAAGPADIQRIGQKRVALVSAHVEHGDLALAGTQARALLDAIPHPQNVSSRVGGQAEEMEASFESLRLALLLALVLVYLVMASLFESLLHPFVIMFTVPLAAVGAVLAILATGISISVVVFIGAILLVGIVVNNAIVLVDRVNRLRLRGMPRRAAVVAGAQQRFRPIVMTTATTVLGLLPMAVGLGEAAELRAPMAITVIGGLLVATLLTLVVIPVVYDLVDRKAIHGDVFDGAPPAGGRAEAPAREGAA